MAFDPKSEAAAGIVKHLRDDEVGWLTTVHKGTPRPVPVWFLWDGDRTELVYSDPKALKARTVTEHPEVSFHFNSGPQGDNVAILYGRMEHDTSRPKMLDNAAYLAKYTGPIEQFEKEHGTKAEAISDQYDLPLVITIEDARGW